MSLSMKNTPLIALLVMLLLLLLSSCSSVGDSITEPIPMDKDLSSFTNDGHGLWGIYSWNYDETTGEIEAVPIRELEAHFDVTDYLQPPKCKVCLAIEILGHTTQMHDMWVLVTLMNPTG